MVGKGPESDVLPDPVAGQELLDLVDPGTVVLDEEVHVLKIGKSESGIGPPPISIAWHHESACNAELAPKSAQPHIA